MRVFSNYIINMKPVFDPSFCHNEREVESKLIVSYLLPKLGYTIDLWRQERTLNRFRLDFSAYTDSEVKTDVVFEAKHPDKNLNDHLQQLKDYMLELQIPYGMLTNGKEIVIYKNTGDNIYRVFRCWGRKVEENIDGIKALIGKEILARELKSIDNNMKIIAVYHNKGGVGKTTTVVNLAATFSKMGKKVLVVDLDSQANTTFATGLVNFGDEEKDNLKDDYVYHILCDEASILKIVKPSKFSSYEVDVVPSHIHLMSQENELNQLDFTKRILLEKLEEVEDKYDVVLIDTPPSLNLYARIALIATDYLIVPSDLKAFANEGLDNVKSFIKQIDRFRKQDNRLPVNILGVLPTKIATNARFIQGTLQKRLAKISKRYGFKVMDSIIFERDDLAKCTEQVIQVGDDEEAEPRSIIDFKPNSKAANEFQKLSQEVAHKIGLSR